MKPIVLGALAPLVLVSGILLMALAFAPTLLYGWLDHRGALVPAGASALYIAQSVLFLSIQGVWFVAVGGALVRLFEGRAK